MTQDTEGPDMVERVAQALAVAETPHAPVSATNPFDWLYWDRAARERYHRLAKLVLEASHHAELVALLRDTRWYCRESLAVRIDTLLAKIGGDA